MLRPQKALKVRQACEQGQVHQAQGRNEVPANLRAVRRHASALAFPPATSVTSPGRVWMRPIWHARLRWQMSDGLLPRCAMRDWSPSSPPFEHGDANASHSRRGSMACFTRVFVASVDVFVAGMGDAAASRC